MRKGRQKEKKTRFLVSAKPNTARLPLPVCARSRGQAGIPYESDSAPEAPFEKKRFSVSAKSSTEKDDLLERGLPFLVLRKVIGHKQKRNNIGGGKNDACPNVDNKRLSFIAHFSDPYCSLLAHA